MGDEAVIVELMGQPKGVPVRYTCDNDCAIEKGALLWLTDEKTVSDAAVIAHAGTYPFAGIASTEKVASDGSTSIGVWTKGIFDLVVSGQGCVAGQAVTLSGAYAKANSCVGVTEVGDTISGNIVGKALGTVTNATKETVQVAVGIY